MDDRRTDKIHGNNIGNHVEVGSGTQQQAGTRHAGDHVIGIPCAGARMTRHQAGAIDRVRNAARTRFHHQFFRHPFALCVSAERRAGLVEVISLAIDASIVMVTVVQNGKRGYMMNRFESPTACQPQNFLRAQHVRCFMRGIRIHKINHRAVVIYPVNLRGELVKRFVIEPKLKRTQITKLRLDAIHERIVPQQIIGQVAFQALPALFNRFSTQEAMNIRRGLFEQVMQEERANETSRASEQDVSRVLHVDVFKIARKDIRVENGFSFQLIQRQLAQADDVSAVRNVFSA